MTDGIDVRLIEGDDDLEVVGESFYQDNLLHLVGGQTDGRVRKEIYVLLVAEHNNRFDANAISVWAYGYKVGHLSRADAALLRPGLLNLQAECGQPIALAGAIVGGGLDDHGKVRLLGVFLDYDSARFGVSNQSESSIDASEYEPAIRTGLSIASATDIEDDSYDLSWVNSLSIDPIKRLTQLRRLVHVETEPISRHYAFAAFEELLYKRREAFPDALNEYDSVCESHDAEMDSILPALLGKFGVVPLLDTYRQAAIRHQKAKDYERALWWTERGISLYGQRAVKQEILFDLHKRAAACRAKIRQATSRQSVNVGANIEVLVCRTCGSSFERSITRGRKPTQCATCR